MLDRCWLFGACVVLSACASAPPAVPPPAAAPAPAPAAATPPAPAAEQSRPQLTRYRCDGGFEFEVSFADGSAKLSIASRAPLVLLRDAGGTSPQHVVYSSTEAKAEFGLGDDHRKAKLNLVSPAVEVGCMRE